MNREGREQGAAYIRPRVTPVISFWISGSVVAEIEREAVGVDVFYLYLFIKSGVTVYFV